MKRNEKSLQKEILKLQNELLKSRKHSVQVPESNHSSNQDGLLAPTTVTTATSSNQHTEKPHTSSMTRGGMFHRNSQPQIQYSQTTMDQRTYRELQSARDNFEQMLTMDCRENMNPNSISFGPNNEKSSNSKVIMQKQMFETMNHSHLNMPRQCQNNFFPTKTPEPHLEKRHGAQQPADLHKQQSQSFIGDFSHHRGSKGTCSTSDLNRLKEKLSQIQGDFKNNSKVLSKRRVSRNECKDAIDLEELEAETARIHREIVAERTLDERNKRTLSDNSRPLAEQQRSMHAKANQEKQSLQPSAFTLKRGTIAASTIMTERGHYNNTGPIEVTDFSNGGAQSSRRHHNNTS